MDSRERTELIARYRAGLGALLDALSGIGAAELDWRPTPEAWSVREVVHHLEDAELTGAVRLRRLLTEAAPAIPAFDEEVYRARLDYTGRAIDAALDAIRAAHATTAELLDRLAPADWARAGTHSEAGPYSVERWLAFHAAHTHEHAAQIRGLRRGRHGASPTGRAVTALR